MINSGEKISSDDQNSNVTQSTQPKQTDAVTVVPLNLDSDESRSTTKLETEPTVEETQPQVEEESEPEIVVEISEADQILLLKLAFAEAGNQDVDGKALVMLVVLNRVKSDEFPDTISKVIYQKNQFSPVASGSFDRATSSNPGCLEALELVMQGYDISQGATYFESLKSYDSWHYRNLNFLFEHGGHWFYN